MAIHGGSALARDRGLEQVFTLGNQSVHAARQCAGARHFEDMPAVLAAVRGAAPGVSSILVKGSRFMKMERVVAAIEAAGTPQPTL